MGAPESGVFLSIYSSRPRGKVFTKHPELQNLVYQSHSDKGVKIIQNWWVGLRRACIPREPHTGYLAGTYPKPSTAITVRNCELRNVPI